MVHLFAFRCLSTPLPRVELFLETLHLGNDTSRGQFVFLVFGHGLVESSLGRVTLRLGLVERPVKRDELPSNIASRVQFGLLRHEALLSRIEVFPELVLRARRLGLGVFELSLEFL